MRVHLSGCLVEHGADAAGTISDHCKSRFRLLVLLAVRIRGIGLNQLLRLAPVLLKNCSHALPFRIYYGREGVGQSEPLAHYGDDLITVTGAQLFEVIAKLPQCDHVDRYPDKPADKRVRLNDVTEAKTVAKRVDGP